jgi:DNA-binding response OmpR family regulator
MKSILLIEDNADILENLQEYLELEGYQIFSTNNGTRGIELAMEFNPDLIICDMPRSGINRHGVLQLLINIPAVARIPFIFISTLSELINKTDALQFGADDYVVKPFELESMLLIAKACILSGSKRQICAA